MLQPPGFENLRPEEFATRMAELQATIKSHLEGAQERYKVTADALRKEQPSFQVGNKVWLF